MPANSNWGFKKFYMSFKITVTTFCFFLIIGCFHRYSVTTSKKNILNSKAENSIWIFHNKKSCISCYYELRALFDQLITQPKFQIYFIELVDPGQNIKAIEKDLKLLFPRADEYIAEQACNESYYYIEKPCLSSNFGRAFSITTPAIVCKVGGSLFKFSNIDIFGEEIPSKINSKFIEMVENTSPNGRNP